MKSGIYKLTFANGSIYIGKSVDIERRWEEHANSFRKGTAAKKLQNAYILAGFPDAIVLLYCHPDHIDLMESVYMIKHSPDLNTTIPIKLNEDDIMVLEVASKNYLEKSTAEHIREIGLLGGVVANLEDEIEDLKDEVDFLSEKRTEEELRYDLGQELHSVRNQLATLLTNHEVLEKEYFSLKKENSRSWWKKLFGIK